MQNVAKYRSTALQILGATRLTELLYAQRVLQFKGTCWIWGGPRTEKGYGVLTVVLPVGGHEQIVRLQVHRVSYELWKGKIPSGLGICHDPELCHDRACFNPSHLRPCNRSENERDKQLKSQQFGKERA